MNDKINDNKNVESPKVYSSGGDLEEAFVNYSWCWINKRFICFGFKR